MEFRLLRIGDLLWQKSALTEQLKEAVLLLKRARQACSCFITSLRVRLAEVDVLVDWTSASGVHFGLSHAVLMARKQGYRKQ